MKIFAEIPTNPHKIYTSPKGRDYRVIGIENSNPKWFNRTKKYMWTIRIKFLDDGTCSDLHYGHNDKLLQVSKI